jgi:hypothetical protein
VQRLLIDHPLTYLRIALVFSVRLEYFFKTETKPVLEVVRKQDRLRFPETPERRYPAYYFESLDFRAGNRKLNSYYAEFQDIDAGHVHKHHHPGVEFLYIVSGKLALQIGAEDAELAEGTPFTLTLRFRTDTAKWEHAGPLRWWW